MALDVCYTLNQFCAPLAETYGDFKAMAATFLPNIIDTKVFSPAPPCPRPTGTSRPWPPPSCPTSSTLRYWTLATSVLWIYGDFKAMATTFLPNIIDTKVFNSGYQCCGSTGTSRPWPPPSSPKSSTLRYVAGVADPGSGALLTPGSGIRNG